MAWPCTYTHSFNVQADAISFFNNQRRFGSFNMLACGSSDFGEGGILSKFRATKSKQLKTCQFQAIQMESSNRPAVLCPYHWKKAGSSAASRPILKKHPDFPQSRVLCY